MITRRILLGAALAALIPGAARAFDILPGKPLYDPHGPGGPKVKSGAGQRAHEWNLWPISPSHYGAKGHVVWMLAFRGNPIPAAPKARQAWIADQLSRVHQALGGEQPREVIAPDRFAPNRTGKGPGTMAEFSVTYASRGFTNPIYSIPVIQRRGRLIVFGLGPDDAVAAKAAAEFAETWADRLRDMHPNEGP